MQKNLTSIHRLCGPVTHTIVSISIVVGMMTALGANYIFRNPQNADDLLLIAIGISCIPLCFELLRGILTRNFRVNILAGLSVLTSLAIHEFWVAAILILIASGSTALEEYAARRAFSLLHVLAKRMPQTAHRVEADGSARDVSAGSIKPGNRLLLYPHELCPVDGVVLDGSGSIDEAYLPGEPLLAVKAPGNLVFSGTMNGNVPLTIEATRQADESQCETILECLRDFAAKASATSSAWSPSQQLVSRIRRCKSAGELVLQRAACTVSRSVGHRGIVHAAHG